MKSKQNKYNEKNSAKLKLMLTSLSFFCLNLFDIFRNIILENKSSHIFWYYLNYPDKTNRDNININLKNRRIKMKH